MQVSQRFAVIERGDLGHDLGKQIEGAIGTANEPLKMLAIVDLPAGAGIVDEGAFGAAGAFCRRQPGECQGVVALKEGIRAFKRGSPFFIDEL